MNKPKLTRNRIIVAYAIAVIAEVLEFPIAAAEATLIGAPEGEFAAFVLDCIVMGAMTKLLGFHWMFLPTFCVEVIPGLDLLPTWVGCVAFVVWQRKKEQAPPPLVVDIQEAEIVHEPPPLLTAQASPPLPPQGLDAAKQPAEERLARLSDLLEKQVITQAEYEAKRQQVLNDS
jgi:hypothetical protein